MKAGGCDMNDAGTRPGFRRLLFERLESKMALSVSVEAIVGPSTDGSDVPDNQYQESPAVGGAIPFTEGGVSAPVDQAPSGEHGSLKLKWLNSQASPKVFMGLPYDAVSLVSRLLTSTDMPAMTPSHSTYGERATSAAPRQELLTLISDLRLAHVSQRPTEHGDDLSSSSSHARLKPSDDASSEARLAMVRQFTIDATKPFGVDATTVLGHGGVP
jgi:hypothetical protein